MQQRSVMFSVVLLGIGTVFSGGAAAAADTATGMEAFRNKDYAKAYREWKAAAEAGHADAQFDLGVLYAQGRGVKRDLTEATKWYRKAAEQGNAAAEFALGQMYSLGWGVPRDEADALRWFQMANDPDSDGPPTDWALIEGYGVQKDAKQAAYWYQLSANKGHAEAQYNLGRLYATGEGVPHDEEQALRWIRAAASQGYAPAEARFGTRYATGSGISQDHRLAYFWLTIAWLRGEKSIEKLRKEEAAKLAPDVVAATEQAAQNWKPPDSSGGQVIVVPLRRVSALLIAAVLPAIGAEGGPQEVLERARARLQSLTHNLSRYACIETVERQYFQPSADVHASSCAEVRAGAAGRAASQRLEITDRLRLEVTVSEGREIYSWPGATRFDARDVAEIIRQGPIGTGSFGTHLLGVFDNPAAEFRFAGQQTSGPQSLFEYLFHIPVEASHYRIKSGAIWQSLAYNGSFLVDPRSLDLQRLTIHAEDAPAATSICQLDGELDYHLVHIGNSDALLPTRAELRISHENAHETNNITSFSDCREYQTESALIFDEGAAVPADSARPQARQRRAIPIGLPVTLALLAPIDTNTAAAGDLVAAKLVKPVRLPGSNDVLFPAGSVVHGRLTRVEHHLLPSPYFLIAISFNRLAVEEIVVPFAARFEGNIELAKELGANLYGDGRGLGFWDVGTFLFPTAKARYVVPSGYESKWSTLAIRGR